MLVDLGLVVCRSSRCFCEGVPLGGRKEASRKGQDGFGGLLSRRSVLGEAWRLGGLEASLV